MSNQSYNDQIQIDVPILRLAILIDADNAQASTIENILTEIAGLGEAIVKRIYGDFTSTHNNQWKTILQKYAIKPVQQFAYTTGKNATDSSLIIDAMDLLYTRKLDGFCLVSSDSDFTGLAVRLREAGLKVYGFGKMQTPEAFKKACHKFIYIEVLQEVLQLEQKQELSAALNTNEISNGQKMVVMKDKKLREFLSKALDTLSAEEEYISLAHYGSYLNALKSDFDARNYGCKKLSELIRMNTDIFEIEERPGINSDQKNIYVRKKRNPN
jgi:uncharacterized LabA/DUF88 family protein